MALGEGAVLYKRGPRVRLFSRRPLPRHGRVRQFIDPPEQSIDPTPPELNNLLTTPPELGPSLASNARLRQPKVFPFLMNHSLSTAPFPFV